MYIYRIIYCLAVFASFTIMCPAQTPDDAEKVYTEEIKINVAAFDQSGEFAADLKKEDLVIMEDGRLHQATSVRLVAPSVLIAMDTGGETRQVKNIKTTRDVAKNLVNLLEPKTEIALINFHDKVELLSDWKTDKNLLTNIIENRTTFGRRSSFTNMMDQAYDFLQKTPTENRHIILITDALDSVENTEKRGAIIEKFFKSGIIVHVVSYSQIEYSAVKPQSKIWRKGEHNPKRMPEEAEKALLESINSKLPVEVWKQTIYSPRLLSVLVDFPFLKEKNSQLKSLIVGQAQLSLLTEYTGGGFVLPETISEMIEKSNSIAKSINAQYIVTYSPKRPLKDAPSNEIRQIEISSKRTNLQVQSTRRLIIFGNQSNK